MLALVKSLVQRLNDGLGTGFLLPMNTTPASTERAFAWSTREVELALKIAR